MVHNLILASVFLAMVVAPAIFTMNSDPLDHD